MFNTGGIYNCNTNSWRIISTIKAPSSRHNHAALWTGSKMIIWGGIGNDNNPLQDGGIYHPASDSWKPMSNVNAPSAREHFSAVWTGSKMIIWGGFDKKSAQLLNTGAIYDLESNTWSATHSEGVPEARYKHHAFWIGDSMFIWGGAGINGGIRNGSRYIPLN